MKMQLKVSIHQWSDFNTEEIINIIEAVKRELPTSYIHGLGVSIPKLKNETLRLILNSADGHGFSYNIWNGDKRKNLKGKLHRWIRQYCRFRSSKGIQTTLVILCCMNR